MLMSPLMSDVVDGIMPEHGSAPALRHDRGHTYADPVPDSRRGLAYGVAAYGLWGLFPLYWPLLEPAGAIEILAHRVLWSLVAVVVVVLVLRRTAAVRAVLADRRSRLLLLGAAVVITVNWGGYIWGVNNGRVVETSLGYFINPLVTVLMGVVVLGERLRRLQWAAVGLAAVAVVVLTVDYGRPPWIALLLAFSFATYGLAKKTGRRGRRREPHRRDAVHRPVRGGVHRVAGLAGHRRLRPPRRRATPGCSPPPGSSRSSRCCASAPPRSGSRW